MIPVVEITLTEFITTWGFVPPADSTNFLLLNHLGQPVVEYVFLPDPDEPARKDIVELERLFKLPCPS
jgi:hypothetical protein